MDQVQCVLFFGIPRDMDLFMSMCLLERSEKLHKTFTNF